MAKFFVRKVTVQTEDGTDMAIIYSMMSELHADIIGRRLKESCLSAKQQEKVVSQIIQNLKMRERDGIIK